MNEAVDTTIPEHFEKTNFALAFAIGVDDDRRISERFQNAFDSAQDRREDGVCDVGDDHADRHRPVGAEPEGNAIGAIVQPFRRRLDLCHDFRRDALSLSGVKRARHGRHVNAGRARDVLQGGSFLLHVSPRSSI
ncbi:hypothetical protein D9M70_565890 [compost metagenome]